MNGNISIVDMPLIISLISKHNLIKYKYTDTPTHTHTHAHAHTQGLDDFPKVERKEDYLHMYIHYPLYL